MHKKRYMSLTNEVHSTLLKSLGYKNGPMVSKMLVMNCRVYLFFSFLANISHEEISTVFVPQYLLIIITIFILLLHFTQYSKPINEMLN